MSKKIVNQLLFIILSATYIFVNTLVILTKGNNRIIRRKLKTGALLLSVSSLIACHTSSKPTCYSVTTLNKPSDSSSVVNKKDSVIKIQPLKRDSIMPTCYEMPVKRSDTIK